MNTKPDTYVVVGEILRPHGIRGELVVRSFADSPSVFRKGRSLRLSPPEGRPGKPTRRTVAALRVHADRLLVAFTDVPDRDAAEALRGCLLSVPARELPALAEDEVYRHQLIGCRVLAPDTPHPDLGVISDILDLPGQEMWAIRHASGREILLPANPHTIADIDLTAGVVIATPPPGLADIYLETPAPGAPRAPGAPGAPEPEDKGDL
ncbi:16S rRNA processing protein RimM [Desulfovibrio sulfodismutans]|uniref:Ribosome maturation factor RimM n=1 Tax=Desulfolutivibrio sulfodismutans TaxID=63561 RepID=A0A7K3NR09_9BACT|nr:ribosome maturation factor RimM [Desulfolutivibrio sulfodismutans]NDY57639.1 16S rRNA processing protein RimM [Desulfolutivibrio sulfodismutans]QLA14060.1 16S rRNA processing protein RimM [Desulfolutivibrio sulfodismutans DSM 3696]